MTDDQSAGIPTIVADLLLLSEAEGGRTHPLDLAQVATYRPHLVIGDAGQRRADVTGGVVTEEYLGVEFCTQPLVITPGTSARVRIRLVYYPRLRYEKAVPGATFTVREGAKIVAYGAIVSRENG